MGYTGATDSRRVSTSLLGVRIALLIFVLPSSRTPKKFWVTHLSTTGQQHNRKHVKSIEGILYVHVLYMYLHAFS